MQGAYPPARQPSKTLERLLVERAAAAAAGAIGDGWMLVIGGVLAVERGTESGRRLTAPLGVARVAAAGIVATAG